MQNFHIGQLSQWQPVSPDEVYEFVADGAVRSVRFDVLADQHVAVDAVSHDGEAMIIASGTGFLSVRFNTALTVGVRFRSEGFVSIRHYTHSQVFAGKSLDESYVSLMPPRSSVGEEAMRLLRQVQLSERQTRDRLQREMDDLRRRLERSGLDQAVPAELADQNIAQGDNSPGAVLDANIAQGDNSPGAVLDAEDGDVS